jgi:hypothetical protein
MRYVIKDLIGQMIDALKADALFAGENVTVARHCGEVNILMFDDPAYWEGLVKKIPFVLIRYVGKRGVGDDANKLLRFHEVHFSAYVGTKNEQDKELGVEEAEVYLAKMFDLWHGHMFNSTQTFASVIPKLNGVQITTSGFGQMRSLMEDDGDNERLIVSFPEIVLYETKYNARLKA